MEVSCIKRLDPGCRNRPFHQRAKKTDNFEGMKKDLCRFLIINAQNAVRNMMCFTRGKKLKKTSSVQSAVPRNTQNECRFLPRHKWPDHRSEMRGRHPVKAAVQTDPVE